ncbi:MAG: HAMP domain-containing sensor histidine kinase [Actinomycetes bacterium]
MRRGITRVALITAMLAVLVFGVPLAYVMNRLLLGNEQSELEQLALRAAVSIPADVATVPARVQLPETESSVRLGVYGVSRRRIAGTGPLRADAAVREALHARVSHQGTGRELVVAVPVLENEKVTAVVRAASPRAAIAARSFGVWAAMVGLALLAGAAAAALAVVQARRLARPIERLEAVAEQLGGGNFSARAEPSGIDEIDRAADALNKTAQRLGDVVSRERAFAAHASHQLRTPLTGLRLTLDTALSTPGADLAQAARAAIQTADELSRTVDDVLSLTRAAAGPARSLDLAVLLADTERRWRGLLAAEGRPLRVQLEDPPLARASEAAVRQIVDVLIDNAFRHGKGAVVVTGREANDAAAVDVQDDGSTTGVALLPDGVTVPEREGGSHLGLALARRLAESEDGRLVHARTEPHTRLTLLLPAADESTAPPD